MVHCPRSYDLGQQIWRNKISFASYMFLLVACEQRSGVLYTDITQYVVAFMQLKSVAGNFQLQLFMIIYNFKKIKQSFNKLAKCTPHIGPYHNLWPSLNIYFPLCPKNMFVWADWEHLVDVLHWGMLNAFVVLPAWPKESHGSLTAHFQQQRITIHYMEHNDSQRRIMGLTSGFFSLTQRFCIRVSIPAYV